MNNIFNINKFNSFLIFLLPFCLVLGPAIPDIIISFTSILFLYKLLIEKKLRPIKNYFIIIFFIWCFYFFIRSMFSYDYLYSLKSSLFFFRFGFFSLLVLYLIKNEKNFIKNFTFFLIIALLLVSLDGIFQFLFGFNILGFTVTEKPQATGRISGLFRDEYIMGSFLSRFLPLSIGLFIYNFYLYKNFNILLILFIIIINIAIFISGERSAFLYCIITNFVIIFCSYKYNFKFLISIILSSIIIFFILNYNEDTKYRYITYTKLQFSESEINDETITEYKSSSNNKLKFLFLFSYEHELMFAHSLNIFKNNLFFGVGPRMYKIECHNPKYRNNLGKWSLQTGPDIKTTKFKSGLWEPYDQILLGCSSHPHNLYLHLLVETGLFGTLPLIIFLFFIVNSLRLVFFERIKKVNKDNILRLDIFIYLSILIIIWPLVPTGSFFNNWLNVINFLNIGFFLYIQEYRKNISD